MSDFVTQAEFARSQGWARSYVTELKQSGRLVLVDGKVDVAASLALIAQTKGGRDDVAERHEQERETPAANAAPVKTGDREEGFSEIPGQSSQDNSRLQVRKLRELMAREDKLIDLGLLKGDILHRDDVNRVWHGLGVSIRAGLEAMLDRLSAKLAHATPEEISTHAGQALREERGRVKRALLAELRGAGK